VPELLRKAGPPLVGQASVTVTVVGECGSR
jgi:hypothetical protein